MKTFFITGVDTDIGKTFVSVGLCLALEKKGYKVGYFKPFQSGAYLDKDNKLTAPDVFEVNKFSTSIKTGYSYLLKGEVSPYLALKNANIAADINKVKSDIDNFKINLDYLIVEGAGGFYCPLCKDKLFCDLIEELNYETIFVTTPHLGRINHTLMTLKCALDKKIKIKGLIINKVPKVKKESEEHFVEELKAFSNVEILAQIPEILDNNKTEIIKAFSNISL